MEESTVGELILCIPNGSAGRVNFGFAVCGVTWMERAFSAVQQFCMLMNIGVYGGGVPNPCCSAMRTQAEMSH